MRAEQLFSLFLQHLNLVEDFAPVESIETRVVFLLLSVLRLCFLCLFGPLLHINKSIKTAIGNKKT